MGRLHRRISNSTCPAVASKPERHVGCAGARVPKKCWAHKRDQSSIIPALHSLRRWCRPTRSLVANRTGSAGNCDGRPGGTHIIGTQLATEVLWCASAKLSSGLTRPTVPRPPCSSLHFGVATTSRATSLQIPPIKSLYVRPRRRRSTIVPPCTIDGAPKSALRNGGTHSKRHHPRGGTVPAQRNSTKVALLLLSVRLRVDAPVLVHSRALRMQSCEGPTLSPSSAFLQGRRHHVTSPEVSISAICMASVS